jgi:hypothetical protein
MLSSDTSGGEGKNPYTVLSESKTEVSGGERGVGAPPQARDVMKRMEREIKIRRILVLQEYAAKSYSAFQADFLLR